MVQCQSTESSDCEISPTRATGPYAPAGPYCSGQLIFEEEFDDLNSNLWQPELSLAGGHVSSFYLIKIFGFEEKDTKYIFYS